MSNWYGAARSNYVKFNDIKALTMAFEPFGGIALHAGTDGRYCLLADNEDCGGWPSYASVEADPEYTKLSKEELEALQKVGKDTDVQLKAYYAMLHSKQNTDNPDEMEIELDFSFEEFVCPYLANGEVLVIMEAGAEKLRYISGQAWAFTNAGALCNLSLSDIYDMVAEKLGNTEFVCTPCEY